MSSPVEIRLATLDDLVHVRECARAAYSKYIERMGCEPAPMVADFEDQIHLGNELAYVEIERKNQDGFSRVFYLKNLT